MEGGRALLLTTLWISFLTNEAALTISSLEPACRAKQLNLKALHKVVRKGPLSEHPKFNERKYWKSRDE